MKGMAVSTGNFNVCITNDVGGTTMLPPGSYRVQVIRQWDDDEIGTRMVGELLEAADQEVARQAGTTEYAPPGTIYTPTTVYFSGDQFVQEANGHFCPNDGAPLHLNNEVTGETYCPRCRHLFDPADECGDCHRTVVYDMEDERYRHAVQPERGCFLIPAEAPDETFKNEDCVCPADDIDTFCPIHGDQRRAS